MNDVTHILSQIEDGDPSAAEHLLPLVYDELRKLAAAKLGQENPGQTLQATALVHEAYIRLVGTKEEQGWNNRGHFFGAAAEAMRRILVEGARRRSRLKRQGERKRLKLDRDIPVESVPAEDILAINDTLDQLARSDPSAAELVKLRYFAGFTVNESAEILGISPRSADYLWSYARSWLLAEMDPD